MKRHLNILGRLQGAGALPFADEFLPLAERATYEALEALSPTRCAGCERAGALICQDCLASLALIDPRHSCIRCGAPFGDLLCTECSVEGASSVMAEALDRCLACAVYTHPLPRIIKAYKDAGERRLAPYLAELLYDTALHAQVAAPDRYGGVLSAADAVVFVPATAAAFRRRGFDHMEAIARPFCGCRNFSSFFGETAPACCVFFPLRLCYTILKYKKHNCRVICQAVPIQRTRKARQICKRG